MGQKLLLWRIVEAHQKQLMIVKAGVQNNSKQRLRICDILIRILFLEVKKMRI